MNEVIVFILLVIVGVWGLNTWGFNSYQSYCARWGQETGRETKFVGEMWKYTDCLVKTQDGWISGSALKSVEGVK